MAIVRFAETCDKCGARSEEYSTWPDCFECLEDFCPACGVVTQEADVDTRESGWCNACIEHIENGQKHYAAILAKVEAARGKVKV